MCTYGRPANIAWPLTILLCSILQETVCHAGPKASKVVFLGNTGRLLTTGFSRQSDRQIGVWSQSNLDVPLKMETLDCSSGVVFPFYDHDTRVVFLVGKVIANCNNLVLFNFDSSV